MATVSNHRFLWKNLENNDGVVGINHDGRNRKRRQDLDPEFMETGAVYVMRTNKFIKEKLDSAEKWLIVILMMNPLHLKLTLHLIF